MKTSIIVQNLKCGGCATTITEKVSALANVSNVTVDVENSTISFEADDSNTRANVTHKLKSLGYPSVDDKNGVLSKAKSFVSCASGKMK